MRRTIWLTLLIIDILTPAIGMPVGWFKDGTYEGQHFFITVAVTIQQGKISKIRILHHGNGGRQYEAMIEPLIDEMIEKQSTKVDAVSGATVSSINLRVAVNNALREAAIVKERFDRDFPLE
jgi:uncharacterized protein with FMN-binding domain